MDSLKLLIGGELVEGANTIDVINPATGNLFVTAPAASVDQAEAAVAAAKAAFPAWRDTSETDRKGMLLALADALSANADDFTRALIQEQGKPFEEASAEVQYTAGFLSYFATQELTPEIIQDDDQMEVEMFYKPLGVVVGISPWNFPLLISANKLGPAIATGNTFILKPAPTTPVTSLMLAKLACDIFPAGVVNVISDANDLGGFFTGHPDVAKVTFTGSTATGKKVAQTSASSLKRITLELGGNDAGIVLDDVNVKDVAPKIFAGAFMNCGQVCIALKRLYVHESQYEEMCTELAALADQAIVGDGLEQGTQIGPLQNEMQYIKAQDYLEKGKANGTVIAGGEVPEGQGYFIRPTIVRDISDGTELVDEEQFAPILPIVKYSDVDDVIGRANNSEYGLGGSVWSSNVDRAKKVARQIDTGTVWINHHLHFSPHIPFGGAKESGIGTEFSQHGIAEFTQKSVISVSKA